jgi:hypothetical protein
MNMPTSPGAPDEAWSTGVQSASPIVSPSLPTHEVAAGGQLIAWPGDNDPGGRDIVADSVAGAVSNAEARYHELQGDTYGQGSTIGDIMSLPVVPTMVVPAADSSLYPFSGLEPTPAAAGFEGTYPDAG